MLNETALAVILNNTRTPEMNRSDLMALIGGCRAAERRVVEICDRFGSDTYEAACDALLERTRIAMGALIRRVHPRGAGHVHRLGRRRRPRQRAVQDGADRVARGRRLPRRLDRDRRQAPGSINFHIHEGLCKLFFGIYMIMAFDPQILFNDGLYDVFEVTLPEGSLLNPRFPAPLSNRLNVHTRFFDCQSGALGQKAPDLSMAAGYGTSPCSCSPGTTRRRATSSSSSCCSAGSPDGAIGDGLDGHSWWPMFRTTPAEYTEAYYPVVIERYVPVRDSGGAGLHRGGPGSRRPTCSLGPGEFTVHDDRALISPWGIGGGRAGGRSTKQLIRADGTEVELPSKLDAYHVEGGRAARVPHGRRGRLGRSAAAPRPPASRRTCSASWSPARWPSPTTAW